MSLFFNLSPLMLSSDLGSRCDSLLMVVFMLLCRFRVKEW